MKIFVSGASGLVGSNCQHYFNANGWEVVGSHFSFPTDDTVPFDTLNPDKPDNFDLEAFSPDVILHCGALTWVDYCEQNPEESFEKTVQSTLNLIQVAKRLNAKLIYISSDYVFDGARGPYREDATPHPVNVYGQHKLEAEQEVLKELPDSLSIRITNVYGDELRHKNFIARLVQQIHEGKELELKLPEDQYATPVNAKDIARALYLLIRDGKSGIYNIASTDYVNRIQLANKVLQYFPEHKVKIEAISTEKLAPPAQRPLFGGLISAKFLKEYPEFQFTNVDDYLKGAS